MMNFTTARPIVRDTISVVDTSLVNINSFSIYSYILVSLYCIQIFSYLYFPPSLDSRLTTNGCTIVNKNSKKPYRNRYKSKHIYRNRGYIQISKLEDY